MKRIGKVLLGLSAASLLLSACGSGPASPESIFGASDSFPLPLALPGYKFVGVGAESYLFSKSSADEVSGTQYVASSPDGTLRPIVGDDTYNVNNAGILNETVWVEYKRPGDTLFPDTYQVRGADTVSGEEQYSLGGPEESSAKAYPESRTAAGSCGWVYCDSFDLSTGKEIDTDYGQENEQELRGERVGVLGDSFPKDAYITASDTETVYTSKETSWSAPFRASAAFVDDEYVILTSPSGSSVYGKSSGELLSEVEPDCRVLATTSASVLTTCADVLRILPLELKQ